MLHRHEFIQNHMHEPTFKSRLLGGLWGAVIGDALGVPVEFCNRARLRSDPVTELREYGTHNQPKDKRQLRLRLRLNSIEEAERWVLSWGQHDTVIRPETLANRLRETAKVLQIRYRTGA